MSRVPVLDYAHTIYRFPTPFSAFSRSPVESQNPIKTWGSSGCVHVVRKLHVQRMIVPQQGRHKEGVPVGKRIARETAPVIPAAAASANRESASIPTTSSADRAAPNPRVHSNNAASLGPSTNAASEQPPTADRPSREKNRSRRSHPQRHRQQRNIQTPARREAAP